MDRVPDLVAPGALGRFGDHGIRAAPEQHLHRALVVGRVEIADALVAATRNGALLVGVDSLGVLAPGKVALGDNDKAVILVTADANGLGGPIDDPADSTNQPYLVYFVSNGAVAGLGDVAVTLVGTLNSASEVSAVNFFAGVDAFAP